MIFYVTLHRNILPPILFWDDYRRFCPVSFLVVHYSCLNLINTCKIPFICIFCDLDIASSREIDDAKVFCDNLQSSKCNCRIFNDPRKVLNRSQLLNKLFKDSVNTFKSYELTDSVYQFRYPVFIRSKSDHDGRKSTLLYSPDEVSSCIQDLLNRGANKDDLIIIEFVDTRDEQLGLYAKYSFFRLSHLVVPRHVIFNQDWEVKFSHVQNAKTIQIEKEFFSDSPHLCQIKEIFEISGIEYGRIDYSLVDGKIEVWEINTNPTLNLPNKINRFRRAGQIYSSFQILKSLKSVFESFAAGASLYPKRNHLFMFKTKLLIFLDRVKHADAFRQILKLFKIRVSRAFSVRRHIDSSVIDCIESCDL